MTGVYQIYRSVEQAFLHTWLETTPNSQHAGGTSLLGFVIETDGSEEVHELDP
jgi:hypothetical protein